MSALALQYPRRPIAVSDDLESFVYVFMYCSLRFHEHSLSRKDLTSKEWKSKKLAELNGKNSLLAL